jgi:hypothetical protein
MNEKLRHLSFVKRLIRFLSGTCLFCLIVTFFMSGYTPPGAVGEVVRNNQTNDIDASPYYYSDVENMAELEEGVRERRLEAAGKDRKVQTQPTSSIRRPERSRGATNLKHKVLPR